MFVSVPGDCHARLAMTYGGTPAPDLVSPLVMLSEVETSRRKPHVRCVGFLDIDGMTIRRDTRTRSKKGTTKQTKYKYNMEVTNNEAKKDICDFGNGSGSRAFNWRVCSVQPRKP